MSRVGNRSSAAMVEYSLGEVESEEEKRGSVLLERLPVREFKSGEMTSPTTNGARNG